jgi:mRNA-degrading endonuclease RelE of RelBE toxin-antitoxin system
VAAYQVELTARARKQYKALDPVIRDRIRRTLLDLARQIPHLPRSKPWQAVVGC